ncbi:transglutaminase TgpA family protein [Bacillus sp. FJAT-45350]|uniref:transglutaminase TgpA family protein n=1 Tax=Bacillus sp. FJAT-45350 TaxID=2011014 RepID=UPI000BB83609|nr:transglutaminaseTgpA domain-containing protein [Bacillus sp. FJAT-45350]
MTARNLFLYGLSYLLLMEWLMPLPEVTDTGYIHVFMLFASFFFLITFLQVPWWLSLIGKVIVTLYGLHILFFEQSFMSREWFGFFISDLVYNIEMMSIGYWMGLTFMFRSLLFLILLAVMSYLLYFWTVQAKRILFFLLFTIIYITVMDTFTEYDATFAIIRTFVIGFLLLGLVTMYRMIDKEKLATYSSYLPIRFASLLLLVILVAGSIGYLSPKMEPQWDDPVPFVKASLGIPSEGSIPLTRTQRIGYGNNDEQLGGGFINDDTPVFYAVAEKGYYWRGESKNHYTGKGWEVTTPEEYMERSFHYEGNITLERAVVSVEMAQGRGFSHVFYPGELLHLNSYGAEARVAVDFHTGKGNTFYSGGSRMLSNYELEIDYPEFSITMLRELDGVDPFEIQEHYLQLPEELPERVFDLAEEIVSSESNRYDKVKAVERYFSRSGYTYETTNIPVPTGDEDYVDQFLFETRRGYCDNFSTSMAVLLRTQGIPTRWVKGFTQGDRIQRLDDGLNVYEVTNENAHSWVEVYFPEVGWVPFEPTRGFTHSFDFSVDLPEFDSEREEFERGEREQPEAEEAMAQFEEDRNENEGLGIALVNWFSSGAKIMSAFAVIALLSVLLWQRKRLIVRYILTRFGRSNGQEAFQHAYEGLLWFLRLRGVKKEKQETLREYARRVDEKFSSSEMVKLTESYEKVYYGGASPEKEWTENRKLWKNLIIKIGS